MHKRMSLKKLRKLALKFKRAVSLSSDTVRDSIKPEDEMQRELLDLSYSRSDVLDIEAAVHWFNIKIRRAGDLFSSNSTEARLKRKAAKRLGISLGDEGDALWKGSTRRSRQCHGDRLVFREEYYGNDIPPPPSDLRYTLCNTIKCRSVKSCGDDEELIVATRLMVWAFGKVPLSSQRCLAWHSTGHEAAYKKMYGNMRGFLAKRRAYHYGWCHTAYRGKLNTLVRYHIQGDISCNIGTNRISLASWAVFSGCEAVIVQANNAYHVNCCDGWRFTTVRGGIPDVSGSGSGTFLAIENKDGFVQALDMAALDKRVSVMNQIRYMSTTFDPVVLNCEHEQEVSGGQYLVAYNNSAKTCLRDHFELGHALLLPRFQAFDNSTHFEPYKYRRTCRRLYINPIVDDNMNVRSQRFVGEMPNIFTGHKGGKFAALCAVGNEMVEIVSTIEEMESSYERKHTNQNRSH